MTASYVASLPVADLPAEPQSGYVVLGYADGFAYLHLAPWVEPYRVHFPTGDLSNGRVLADEEPTPDSGMTAVFETPKAPIAELCTPVWTPADGEPFRWDAFAAAMPDLAATLTPHQWAGE